jgi:soluble lytic murein transglycosylase
VKRIALAALLVAAAAAGVAVWVVSSQPEWYQRVRYPLRYEAIVRAHARNYDLPPALLAAVIYAESKFDASARSGAGAVGLMQLLPDTAQGIAERTGGHGFVQSDLLDPEINVRYGAWYLRHLLDRYDGDVPTALAAYHAGQGNVDGWRRRGVGIQFPETRAYVQRVLDAEQVYADAYADELGGG